MNFSSTIEQSSMKSSRPWISRSYAIRRSILESFSASCGPFFMNSMNSLNGHMDLSTRSISYTPSL